MVIQAACAQFAPAKAEVEANLDRIANIIRQAASEGVDLLVFPETATSGYFVEGGAPEVALSVDALASMLGSRLPDLSRAIDVVVGHYELADHDVFNSATYFECLPDGKVEPKHTARKFFLANYGVFDEERFVSRGRELEVVQTRLGVVAILICEDVWHSIMPTLMAAKGAEFLVIPSASPGRGFSHEKPDNLLRYERMLCAIGEEHGVWCVNSMLAGFEGGKGFVGGSMVVDPTGAIVAQSPMMDEHLLIAKIDKDQIAAARAQTPLISDLRAVWSDIVRIATNAELPN